MAADLILTNGVVHTVDAARSVREAVAVADGRIVAVGSAGEMAELAGPGTRIVDVEGGMVLPGFQDAHCHLALSGYEQTLCDLFESRGAEQHLRRIAEYARAHPDRGWVLGGGWSMSDFVGGIPTREQLDAVVPDRPAVLTNRDGHGSWANTRALELAGIDRDTPDPAGGRIERDEHGDPVGMLQEQAMWLVLSLAPGPDADQRAAGVLGAQEYYHRLGITACQDAEVKPEYQEAYERLARSGDLTLRVRANLGWEPTGDDSQLDELIERRLGGTVGRLNYGNVKFFHDGVVENRTAAMLDTYLDAAGSPTDEYGIDQYPLADLARHVARCDAAGFGIHIHAIGDRAVRESLDVLEQAADANGRRDSRHQLAHVQFAHRDDLPRFRELGVIANVTPLWARLGEYVRDLTLPFISPEAGAMMYPFGSILRARGQPRVRKRLVGVDTGPAAPAGRGRRPRRPGVRKRRATAARRAHRPGQRDRRAHDRRRARRVPGRHHRIDRARQAGRPGGARPRPVRAAAGRLPRGPGAADACGRRDRLRRARLVAARPRDG
jgi:predicted amidohydrolase YtcJ